MPRAYRKLLFSRSALRALGAMDADVQACLKEAFKNLKSGALAIQEQRPWRVTEDPGYVHVCHHTVYVSEYTQGNVLVVLYMLADVAGAGDDDADVL